MLPNTATRALRAGRAPAYGSPVLGGIHTSSAPFTLSISIVVAGASAAERSWRTGRNSSQVSESISDPADLAHRIKNGF